jgi:hypothetical protein
LRASDRSCANEDAMLVFMLACIDALRRQDADCSSPQ